VFHHVETAIRASLSEDEVSAGLNILRALLEGIQQERGS